MTVVDERLPTRVRVLLTIVSLAGLAVSLGAASVVVGEPVTGDLLATVAAVAAVVLVGDVALLQIRLGRNGNGFTWAEAALILAVAIGGWAWLLAVTGPVVLLRQLAIGRPAYKAAFNAGGAVLSSSCAWVAYGLVSGQWAGLPTSLGGIDVLGLAVAAAVYFLATAAQVTTVVAWAQGLRARDVWERGSRLRVVMFLGNSAVGLGAVLVAQWNRPTILVLPFFLLLLYVLYNSALKAQQERDLWRELHAATMRLNRVELPEVLSALRHGAGTLFGSEYTALLLAEDIGVEGVQAPALLAVGSAATGPVIVEERTAQEAVSSELRRLGLLSAVLAPLVSGGRTYGTLLLGFRTPVRLNKRGLAMIGTFADQTSISLQHGVLFDEIDAQRSRLSVILDNASDGILLVDASGVVRSWNPAMGQLTGRSEAEAVGAPLESALPGTLDDGQPLTAARLFAPSSPEVGGRVITADGRQRDVSLALATVQDADAEYAVVVARDVTAQREVQQAKEDFIATVSHELRTPLTPIKGYLKLLQRPGYGDDPGRRDQALTVLVEQATQLERLVEDLLSVSRMSHGQFDVQPEVGDVDQIVCRAVRDQRLSSTRVIRYAPPPAPLPARCDPARLQQVVTNLLSNADKYSPAGEPVVVRVRQLGAEVEVAVTDRGAGVPVESREAVFEPFQRLGHHLTRETRGTGLGLHIAQRLVRAMDGRIWVDGSAGEGATFHLTVPVAPPVPDHEQAAQGETAYSRTA